MKSCSALILAAGKSRRMKQQKLSLRFDEKSSFIERIIEQYKKIGCCEIIVVLNSDGEKLFNEKFSYLSENIKVVLNENPDMGRSHSIILGMQQIPKTDLVFIQNIDNPFVNQDTLTMLLENIGDTDYASPQYNGKGGHPILLTQNIVRTILTLEGKYFILKELLDYFRKKIVVVENSNILININTREDYDKYFPAT